MSTGKYRLTSFSIRSYPFEADAFENEFNEHFNNNHTGKELIQVWHSNHSATGSASFDYFNVLWREVR